MIRFTEKPQPGYLVPSMEAWASSLLGEIYKQAGFGPEDIPSRPVRTDSSSRVMELEPTFRILSLPKLPYATIPANSISVSTTHPFFHSHHQTAVTNFQSCPLLEE
jgi:hypothetical protein